MLTPKATNPILLKQSYQRINSCDKCPLNVFIDCLAANDYSGLDWPTEAENKDAFAAIRKEYATLVKDPYYASLSKQYNDVIVLSTKIKLVESVLTMMGSYYVPEFGQLLAFYGVRADWQNLSSEDYVKQLRVAASKTKSWLLELQQAEKTLETESKKNTTDADTKQYFYDVLLSISKVEGYRLSAKDISVMEFAILVNKNKQQHGKGANK